MPRSLPTNHQKLKFQGYAVISAVFPCYALAFNRWNTLTYDSGCFSCQYGYMREVTHEPLNPDFKMSSLIFTVHSSPVLIERKTVSHRSYLIEKQWHSACFSTATSGNALFKMMLWKVWVSTVSSMLDALFSNVKLNPFILSIRHQHHNNYNARYHLQLIYHLSPPPPPNTTHCSSTFQ